MDAFRTYTLTDSDIDYLVNLLDTVTHTTSDTKRVQLRAYLHGELLMHKRNDG